MTNNLAMIISEHITWAISSIYNNKLRSWLSMLWIIIWVFSIIVMMALWAGTQASIVERFNWMWANLITISAWWQNSSNVRTAWSQSKSDLIDDAFVDFIKNTPLVKWVSPNASASKQFIYWTYNTNTQIIWVKPIYKELKNIALASGNFISDEDVDLANNVVILWNTLATNAFWKADPLWQEIKLQNNIFVVIWVLSDNSQTNNRLIAPISTVMQKLSWAHYYSSVDVQIENTDQITFMKWFLEQELNRYLNITDTSKEPYTINSLSEMLSSIEQVTWTLTAFLAWIAAISLIVWWIWVMNIMLVSVTERTREIWIRKAIWATREDILIQFLTESLIISIFAWLLGIWLSYLTIQILNKYITSVVTLNSIMISFFSVVLIWIVFGILPASKASKLKPIDALRFE